MCPTLSDANLGPIFRGAGDLNAPDGGVCCFHSDPGGR